MITKEPRMTFSVTDDLEKRLYYFRFRNRFKSMTEAIRILLQEGLKKYDETRSEELGERVCPICKKLSTDFLTCNDCGTEYCVQCLELERTHKTIMEIITRCPRCKSAHFIGMQ